MVGALLRVMRAWPVEARPIALVAQAHSWVRVPMSLRCLQIVCARLAMLLRSVTTRWVGV